MAILIETLEESRFTPYVETWKLNNKIEILIFFYEDKYGLAINTDSGDVTDQVYELLNKHKNYSNIKLTGGSRYFLDIEKILLKEIMDFVEKIDVSTLKEGKSY
jgi:hypothetical protein